MAKTLVNRGVRPVLIEKVCESPVLTLNTDSRPRRRIALVEHTPPNIAIHPRISFAIVIAVLAFLRMGPARQRPRDPALRRRGCCGGVCAGSTRASCDAAFPPSPEESFVRVLTPTDNKRFNEMIGFVGLSLAVLLALSLLSYSPHDASFNVSAAPPSSGPARNWIGPVGAHTADLFFQLAGYGA